MHKNVLDISGKNSGFKQRLFYFWNQLIPKSYMSENTAIVIMILSMLQNMSFSAFAPERIRDLLEYLRIYPIMNVFSSSSLLYFGGLYLAYLYVLIISVVSIINLIYMKQILLGLLQFLLPLIHWIGVLPITEIIMSVFEIGFKESEDGTYLCQRFDEECWNVNHIVHCGISLPLVLLWLLISYSACIVLSYSQPFSDDPFAHFNWKFELVYTTARLALLVNHARFYDNWIIYLIISFLEFFYVISILIDTYPYYNHKLRYTFACCTCVRISFELANGISHLISLTNVEPLNFSIGLTISWSVIVLIIVYKHINKRISLLNFQINSPEQLDLKMYLIAKSYKPQVFIPEIHEYDNRITQKELNAINFKNSSETIHKIVEISQNNFGCFANNPDILLNLAKIHLIIGQNFYQSHLRILETHEQELSFLMEFQVFCTESLYVRKFHKFVKRQKDQVNQAHFYKLIKFESKFIKIQELMRKTAETKAEFWRTLKGKSNLNMIHKLGCEIIKLNENVSQEWIKLCKICPFHTTALKVMKSYTKNILGDISNFSDSPERKKTMFIYSEKACKKMGLRELFDNQNCVLIVSNSRKDKGKILACSKSSYEMFGYQSVELKGQNIEILMPPIIAGFHNKIIETHFERGVTFESVRSFAEDRSGNLVLIELNIQQIYNLKYGHSFIASIRKITDHYKKDFIITNNIGIIQGISAKVSEILKIDPRTLSLKTLKIQDMVAEFKENFELMTGAANINICLEETSEFSFVDKNISENSKKYWKYGNSQHFTAKCEIENIEYKCGLKLKLLVFPKGFYSQDISSKKGNSLNKEIMNSIHTVMRAVRKFKSMASQSKNKENFSIHNLAMKTLMLKKIAKHRNSASSPKSPSLSHAYINSTFSPRVRLNSADSPKEEKKEPIQKLTTFSKDLPEPANKISSVLRNNLASENNEDSRNSIKSTLSEGETRKIRESRSQKYENFFPEWSKKISLLSYAYILAIVILIGARSLIEIFSIRDLSENVLLLQASKDRFEGAIWIACYMFTYQVMPQSHCYLYEKNVPGIDIRNFVFCKSYIRDRLKENEDKIFRSQKALEKAIKDGLIDHPELVNPTNLTLQAGPGRYINMSLNNALNMEYMYSVRYRDTFILANVFKDKFFDQLMDSMQGTMQEVSDSIHRRYKNSENTALYMLIAVSILPIFFFSILIPYLCTVRKEIDKTLLILLEVPNSVINTRYEKTMKFIFKTSKYMQNMKINEFNHGYDPDTIENNSQNSIQENDEKTPINQKEILKIHKTEQVSHSRSAGHNIQKYNTKIWYALLFIMILVGVTDGVYIATSYMQRQISDRVIGEIAEVEKLYEMAYYVSVLFPTTTFLVVGTSGKGVNSQIYPNYVLEFLANTIIHDSYGKLSDLIGMHAEARNQLEPDLDEYFTEIFREDICLNRYGTAPYCNQLVHGPKPILSNKLLKGAYETIAAFLSLDKVVVEECASGKLPNMNYLVELSVSWNHVLNPAFTSISEFVFEEIVESYDYIVEGNIPTFIVLAFVAVFVLGFGLRYLIGYLRKELFDAKSLIVSLPIDIIKTNKIVYDFLTKNSPSSNDN